ncbi:MAG TPA: sigma-54 dependent transcriptional regulator, partial [Thermodesulfobacteriota bacterium]|nr:sigma-54 dependent transcriptional regulator [Thermodesulfobacteriota bacterium]
GYDVFTAFNAAEGIELAKKHSPRIAIVDLRLPDMDGIELIKRLNELDPPPIPLIMTAHGYVEAAVSAMKLGAYDFLEKPFPVDKLKIVLQNALKSASLEKAVDVTTRQERKRYGFGSLVGTSEAIREVASLLEKLSACDPKMVLITGETGTGKGLAAKVLHYNGKRADKPFLEMNCAAIPENLLESELFGYEAGSFTDAKKARSGILEDADGGTILLDEIGDMSLNLQAKLVKVVEERKFRRLGGKKDIKVDLQIVAATNKDLAKEVNNNRFRQDLYHRLNVISFEMPTLRERKEDIPLITKHFVEFFNTDINRNIKTIPDDILKSLTNYDWPGNVRELRSTIEKAMILSDGEVLNHEYIRINGHDREVSVRTDGNKMTLDISLDDSSLEEIEQRIIKKTLEDNNWNQTRTARMLKMNRQNLRYRM